MIDNKGKTSVDETTATDGLFPRRVGEVLHGQLASSFTAGLYLVATPIGNLADITLRALAVLATADVIYCEDKRHSSKLLGHFAIRSELRAYHEHNAEEERGPLLARVEAGARVALISDAGTPLISDPGYKLVREALQRNLPVIAIPGPSAVLAGLVSSGLPTDSFHFAGFLPPKQVARRKRLQQLAGINGTLVLYESPKRLAAALADMVECLGARPAAVARELTKLHETILTGELASLAERYHHGETIRGEIVVLIGPPDASERMLDDDDIRAALTPLLVTGSLKDAVKAVSVRYELPRARVYDLAVQMKRESEPE